MVSEPQILTLYTDGRSEYQILDPYLHINGIQHLVSPPYTPQMVAMAEWRHHHLVETAKTLLHQAALPSAYWSFSCHHATYLINRLPRSTLNNKSPFEVLFNDKPAYASLRTFGCLCYPWLRPYAQNKLEPYSKPCVYLGFSITHHSHQCFDPTSSKLFLSRDVKFFEYVFPFDSMFTHLKQKFSSLTSDNISSPNKSYIFNHWENTLDPATTQFPPTIPLMRDTRAGASSVRVT